MRSSQYERRPDYNAYRCIHRSTRAEARREHQMIHYICKYTPVEMLEAFGETCTPLESLSDNYDRSDSCAHANLCGYGKSLIEAVLSGKVTELILVNCCDTIRRCYDVIRADGKCRFLFMLDLPHETGTCSVRYYAEELRRLYTSYAEYSGKSWNPSDFGRLSRAAGTQRFPDPSKGPYIGLLGAHSGSQLYQY